MATGLVLEGGGMRGLFSTGIIDALLEEGIEVDGMIGVSAGALTRNSSQAKPTTGPSAGISCL